MIPVSLYGVDVNRCESFYDKLPGLVADSIDDEEYSDALFAIQNKASMEHIKVAENWANRQPYAFPEEVANEIEMIIRTVSYPDVALLEHLLTIEVLTLKGSQNGCTSQPTSIQYTARRPVMH